MDDNLKITLVLNGGAVRTVEFAGSALVGSGRAADLRVPDPTLAPAHLRLTRMGKAINAIPLASGVLLEGEELDIDESYAVGGRTLEIGCVQITASIDGVTSDPVETSQQRTDSLARELMRGMLEGPAGVGPRPEFVVEGGPAKGQRKAVSRLERRLIIGRGETATWILLDPDLSRSHATIECRDDGVRVYDVGSKNGTKVNGRPVSIGPPGVLLEDGAIITLGDTRLRYIDPAAHLLAELEAGLDAAARGVPGAITQTKAGHGRAREALESHDRSGGHLGRGTVAAIAVAVLVALTALCLLLWLVTSA